MYLPTQRSVSNHLIRRQPGTVVVKICYANAKVKREWRNIMISTSTIFCINDDLGCSSNSKSYALYILCHCLSLRIQYRLGGSICLTVMAIWEEIDTKPACCREGSTVFWPLLPATGAVTPNIMNTFIWGRRHNGTVWLDIVWSQ